MEGNDSWNAHAEADGERPGGSLELLLFLSENHGKDRRQFAAADVLAPRQSGKAGFGLLFLIGLRGLHRLWTFNAKAGLRIWRTERLLEPAARFSTESGFFGSVVEIHVSFP